MVEPVSVACGVLYAGLGKVLWDGAVEAGKMAVGGVLGNRSDKVVVAVGHALHGRLLGRRGLSENHDIARALRKAQILATEFIVETYARRPDPNPPVAFLAGVRAGLASAKTGAEALDWDPGIEAAMFASYQQAFRAPQDDDDPMLLQTRLVEQTTQIAWEEVERWADGAHAPDRLKARFFGQVSQVIGFYDAWCGEVVEAMKTDPRFRAIFVADKLVEVGDAVIHGQAVLAQLEVATEGVREQLTEMRRWLETQFAAQHTRHDETQEMLRRIEAMMLEQGRTLALDEREAVEATLDQVAASTGPDLEQARAGLSDEDPVALIDGLEAAAVRDAATRLRQAGTIAYAIDVERARRIYGKVAALDPDDHWTHVLLGRLATLAGDLAAARAAAQRALDTSTDDRDRMVVFNGFGDLARAEGDLAAARAAYEDGLAIAKDLSARDTGHTEWNRDVSVSYERLGDVARAEGDLVAARAAYEDGLAIRKDLSARDPSNTEWKRDLSVIHARLGDMAVAEGDLAAARAAYEDGLAVAKDLSARDPGNTGWKRDLSVSHDRLGDVAVAEGDLAAARAAYEDGVAIRKDLSARDPGNTEWKRDLSVSHSKLGDVAVAEGDLSAARAAYEADLAIAKDLSARDSGNTGWKRDLSVSHDRLGDVARAEDDLAAARAAYEDGLAIRKDLSARDPGNTQWKHDLSVSHERLGDVAVAEGDLAAARAAYEDSLAIRKDLSARDPGNTEWKRALAVSFAKLAQTAEAAGDRSAARAGFLDAERAFRAILAISPSHAETRRMADAAAALAARLAD
jgi:tetratricopeptide (TPR) repeat protein